MKTATCAHDTRGVSLVELLVAMAILAVALTPLLGIFLQSLKLSEKAYRMSMATNLARDMAEEIRVKDFWEPYFGKDLDRRQPYFPYRDPNPTPQPFGLDTINISTDGPNDNYVVGNPRYLAFDDVDDYHGWCRGKDCETFCLNFVGTPQEVLCRDNTYLETYDGKPYNGRGGYPLYADFTRRVEVFNIHPSNNASKTDKAAVSELEHPVIFETYTTQAKDFLFYDLRAANFQNLTTRSGMPATGRTRLKVVRVTVEYTGPLTPPIKVEDVNLITWPISAQ